MRVYRLSVKTCALLSALAALLAPARPRAASCCGGGGGGATVLPRGARAMADLAVEWERYDGYWDASGQHKADPAGSSLAQYRATLALAGRLATRWQAGVTLPYVWNANRYSGLSSRTRGLGDTAVSLWYEAFDERSAWRVASAADLLPSVTAGLSLTIPTGLSPYDDVASSFDVTGRGFYRVDGNLQLDKSYRAFSASVALGYGLFLDRPVNRFYGRWVEPYHKHMGPRASASGSLGYRYFIGTGGDALTLTAGVAWLRERQGTLGGAPDPASGMRKASFSATLAWSSTDADWTARLGWSRAPAYDGWGSNFPSTDVFSLGVRRVLP